MIKGNEVLTVESVNDETLERRPASRLIRRISLISNPVASFQEEGIPGAEATAIRKGPRMSKFMRDEWTRNNIDACSVDV